jgi:hypothetical protein
VSTTKQDLTRQLDALAERGIPADRIWVDTKTGASAACSRWGLLPLEFAFWIGFALPLGPVVGLARPVLVFMAWSSLRRPKA